MTLEKIKSLPCSTKDELLYKLMMLVSNDEHDDEVSHIIADKALLEYISNEEVTKMFNKIGRWYA